MDFPTRSDYFLVGRNEVLAKSALLSAEAVERDGTDVNILTALSAAMADAVTGQLLLVCAGQFLDSSEDLALDRYVFDRYGMVRKPAAPALGRAKFTTTVATTAAFTIPAGTVLQTARGTQFVVLFDTTFPNASTGPVYATVRSVLAGADQQIKIGQLTNIVSQIAGAPSTLAVTNEVASAGAADRETDEELRDRARRFWTTARRGTLAAIEAGALAVPGVLRASAIEAVDAIGRQNRWVYLVIADKHTDALATLNTTSPSYQAQSQALAEQVFRSLSDVRCCGIFIEVQVAQTVLLQVRLDLTFSAGVDIDDVTARARARVVNYTNELAPGETWDPDEVVTALREVNGLIITGNEVASPAGSVIPKAVQVIRSSIELVNATTGGGAVPSLTNPDAVITASLPS